MGIGGVGANAVQGAGIAGATRIIAIDPAPYNREMAGKFGATHMFASAEEALEPIKEMTRGEMASSALVTVDVTTGKVIADAVSVVGKGGKVALTSLAAFTDTDVQFPILELIVYEKRLIGCLFGHSNPRSDIPKMLSLYRDGKLMLDELVTRTYTLDQINEGYEAMRTHQNVRGLVLYERLVEDGAPSLRAHGLGDPGRRPGHLANVRRGRQRGRIARARSSTRFGPGARGSSTPPRCTADPRTCSAEPWASTAPTRSSQPRSGRAR